MFNKILFLCSHTDFSLAAPLLAVEKACGISLNITRMRNGNYHILFLDEIFDIYFFLILYNLGTPLIPVFILYLLIFWPLSAVDGVPAPGLFRTWSKAMQQFLVFSYKF